MPFSLRSATASGALCLLVATGAAAAPAGADPVSPDCATATAQVAAARTAVGEARSAFHAAQRPLGRLLAEERKAARVEVRTSRAAIRQEQRAVARTHDRAERKALREKIRAERADVRHGNRLLESKRALWRVGYVSGYAGDEAARGRPTPAVVLGASNYLVSQADTGLVCSLGMTAGVASLVEAYAPADVRDRLLPGLRADDPTVGIDGSMFLTERDGGSDLGSTVRCTARDLGDGRVAIDGEKWFCSNIDGAAIVLLARPEGAPEKTTSPVGTLLVPSFSFSRRTE